MIRKLLATTALATLLASGAYAQTATAPAEQPAPAAQEVAPAAPIGKADGTLMTNIIGETVYNGAGDDAENIGKVTDVVFDKDGQAKSVVIGVGGFLGIGDKDVAFDYGKLEWAEKNGDRWLIAQTTKDELTAQPAFDPAPFEPAQAAADTTMAPAGVQAPSTTTVPPAGTEAPADTAMAPAGAEAPSSTTLAPSAGQTAPADTAAAPEAPKSDGMLASNIMGENVYNGTADDAQNIGDVNDIVLSKDGKAEQLVIGVGGFLGLGEKSVAYDFAKATWAEKDGDRWLVAETTKEELTAQPGFDRKAYDPAPAPATAATEPVAPAAPIAAAPATDPNADTAAATDTTTTAAIDKSTLTEMPADKISADELIGTTVYGANDANVGKIGDVVLSADNKIDAIVLDVGGFLGIGSKPVAVGMDNLKFMTDKDGNAYLYTSFTKEQLDAQVAYDKGSYADKRDEQRMIIQ